MLARPTFWLALCVTGCSAPPMPPPPGVDHPANPAAAESPVVPVSDTLAIDADLARPVPPPGVPAEGDR